MGYYSIVMPRENAWEIFNELGGLSALQFNDLNAGLVAFNRPYSNYLQRCGEMENKL
jgi:V-type H+-transporting ATPase subunit a